MELLKVGETKNSITSKQISDAFWQNIERYINNICDNLNYWYKEKRQIILSEKEVKTICCLLTEDDYLNLNLTTEVINILSLYYKKEEENKEKLKDSLLELNELFNSNINGMKKIERIKKIDCYYSSFSFISHSICESIAKEYLAIQKEEKKWIPESEYQKELERNFNKYFPDYILLKNRKISSWICDILAKDMDGRDIIIELKIKSFNAKRQLLAYGSDFNNPILINISELPVKQSVQHNSIKYLTYKDIWLIF